MTEINTDVARVIGPVSLDDIILTEDEMIYLYVYLKENRGRREKELEKARRKAKRLKEDGAWLANYRERLVRKLEDRNHYLDDLARRIEAM